MHLHSTGLISKYHCLILICIHDMFTVTEQRNGIVQHYHCSTRVSCREVQVICVSVCSVIHRPRKGGNKRLHFNLDWERVPSPDRAVTYTVQFRKQSLYRIFICCSTLGIHSVHFRGPGLLCLLLSDTSLNLQNLSHVSCPEQVT